MPQDPFDDIVRGYDQQFAPPKVKPAKPAKPPSFNDLIKEVDGQAGSVPTRREQRRQNVTALQDELTATSPQVKPGNTLNVTTGRQYPTPPPPPFQSPIDMRLNAPNEAQKAFDRAAAAVQPAPQTPAPRPKQTLGQMRQQAGRFTPPEQSLQPVTPEQRKQKSEQFLTALAEDKVRQQAAAKAKLEEEASRASQSTLGRMGTRFARGAVRGTTQTPFEFVQMVNPDPVVQQTMKRIADDSKEWQSQNLPVDNRNPATLNVFKPEFYSLDNVSKAATENIPEVLGEMLPQMALARGAGGVARAATAIPRIAPTTAAEFAEQAAAQLAARKGAELAARTAAGGYGAAQQSTQAYQKALDAGMTPGQAARAAAIEAPIGFSEFLGSPGTTGFTRPGTTIRREMREEGLQELGQNAASGLAGKYVSGYDANKPLSDIAGESIGSGLLGAATGGIVATPGARLQARQQANQQRATRSAIDQRSAANAAAIAPKPAAAQPQPSAPATPQAQPQAQPQGFPRLPEPEGFNARRAKLLGMPTPAEVDINEQVQAAAQLLNSTNEGDQRQGRRMLNKALTDLRKAEGYLAEAALPPDAPRPFTAVRDAIEARLKPAPKAPKGLNPEVQKSVDLAKQDAVEAEQAGNYEAAANHWKAAHSSLVAAQREIRRSGNAEQIKAIATDISIADANRRKAMQAARTAQRQAGNKPVKTPDSPQLQVSPNAPQSQQVVSDEQWYQSLPQKQREILDLHWQGVKPAAIQRQVKAGIGEIASVIDSFNQRGQANAPTAGLPENPQSAIRNPQSTEAPLLRPDAVQNPEGGIPQMPEASFTDRLEAAARRDEAARGKAKPAKRLLSRIAELGGISDRYAGELQDVKDARRIGVIRQKAEMSPDVLARQLQSEGYDVDPEDLNTLWEAARRDIAGRDERTSQTSELERRLAEDEAAYNERQGAINSSEEDVDSSAQMQTAKPMRPIDKAMATAREQRAARNSAIESFLAQHGESPFMAPIHGGERGQYLIAHRSTKPGSQGQWQFSRFDEKGAIGDHIFEDFRKGLDDQIMFEKLDLSQAQVAPPFDQIVADVDAEPTNRLREAEYEGDDILQRIEEPGVGRATFDKPHGIYTTPGSVESPHADLGGQVYKWRRNRSANVLDVSHISGKEVAMRRGATDAGSGVYAARELLGAQEFQRLKGMSKSELAGVASKMFPDISFDKYYDSQEVMETIGAQLAKQKGYDAIEYKDIKNPEFSEYVGLTERAMSPLEDSPSQAFQPDTADLREVREFSKREPRAEQFTEEPPTAPLARRRQPIRPPAPASPRQVGNRPLSVDVAGTRTPTAMSPDFPRARREMVKQGREVEARLTEGQDKGEFGNVAEAMFKSNTPDVLHGQDSFFHDPDVKGKLGLTREAEMADVRRELKTQLARSLGLSADEVSLSHIKPEVWRAWAKQKGLGREAVRKLEAGIVRAERKDNAIKTNAQIVAEESQRAQSEVRQPAAKADKSIDAQIKDIRDLQAFDLIDDKEAKRKIAALEAQRPKIAERREAQQRTREDVENSPEFKRWFGDSKVVDESGKPLVVYHGTGRSFDEFRESFQGSNTRQSGGELGFFFTAKDWLANEYAEIAGRGGWGKRFTPTGENVIPVYLRVTNPKKYDTASSFYREAEANKGNLSEWRKRLEKEGYDGVIVRDDLEEIIVFSPSQIKSAIGNRGTFDPASAKITEHRSEAMPERYTGRQLFENAQLTFRPARNRPATLVANDWGGAMLNQLLNDTFGITTTDANFTIAAKDAKDLRDYLAEAKDSGIYEPAQVANMDAMLRQMDAAIADAEANQQDVAFVTRRPAEPISATKAKIRHETAHLSQSRIAADLSALTGKNWLDSQPNAKDIHKELDRRGYAPETHDYEAAAFVASGDYGVFGMNLDQAAKFLSDYFGAVVEKHGKRALQKFGAIDPRLQPVLEAQRETGTTRSSTDGRTNEAAPKTPRRIGAASEARGSSAGVRTERRERRQRVAGSGFSFGRIPEGQGQVLASGFNVQGLFGRVPKEAKPAKPVPLPRNFNLADWSQKLYRDAMAAGLPKDARAKYDAAKTVREKNVILMESKLDSAREAKIFDLIDRAQAAAEKNDGSALYDVLSDATDLMRKTPSEWGLKRVKDEVGNLVSLPRAVMASADVSAPLRQGAILTLPPSQWGKVAKATVRMFQAMIPAESRIKGALTGNRKVASYQYDRITKEINLHPDAETAREAGLYLSTDKSGLLVKKEEDFISGWADNIPIVAGSERAYKTYLDSLRMDSFARYKKSIDKTKGLSEEQKQKAYQAAAEWINTATGRGSLGSHFESAMPILSKTLFAPRYAASRIQVLNPYTYAKNARTPEGRAVLKNQMLDMVQYAGMVSLTLALASAAGATVGLDPEDPDFLKIKVGQTRYDVLAGLQQPMRLFYRVGDALRRRVTGEKSASRQTAMDIAARYGRSKLAPVPSFFLDYVTGKDFVGRDFEMKRAVLDRVVPLMWKDMADAYEKEGGAGAVKMLPAAFGIGVQNYGERTGATKESRFTKEAEGRGLKYDFIRQKVGEPEAIYKQRVERVEGWMSEYGDKLLSHPSYSLLTESQKQAAIESLRRRIGAQQNATRPRLDSLAPEKVIQSVLKSEATRPKREAGKLWSPPANRP